MARKRYIAGSVCTFLFLGIALYGMLGVPALVDKIVLQKVWLDPEKLQNWGQNPGKSNTTTLRNYTFFNLTNPLDFLFHNQTPIFHEISGYLLQERTNFTNLIYSEDYSTVNFSTWNFFTEMEGSRGLDEQIYVANLGPLGFWSQLESSSIVWFAIQGYGGIYYQLSISMKNQAIGQGITKQYLKDFKSLNSSLCSVMNLTSQACLMLWQDPVYGLSDQNNYELWVSWVLDDHLTDGAILVQYFGFTRLQILTFRKIFLTWCEGMRDIFQNWYCQGRPCSSYDMMVMQMAGGKITNNPPSGEAHQSICQTGNVTCDGWPELYTFYKNVFLRNNTESRFKNLTFSQDMVRHLFEPYRGVLLNVGNQTDLLTYGKIYQLQPQNQTNLNLLQSTTHAPTIQHAIVVYEYFKYFVYTFAMKYHKGGSRKQTGYAQTFVRYLYKSFNQVYEWLKKQYVSILVAQAMGECEQFMRVVIEEISEEKVMKICQNVQKENYRQYYRIVQPCENELNGQMMLSTIYNLTNYEIEQYCDPTERSILTILEQVHLKIWQHFNCSANKNRPRCTPHELVLLQFFNSSISLNPIPNSIKNYPISTTLHTLDSSLPKWQYRHYLQKIYKNPDHHSQQFNYSQAADLLSFDKLMSNPMVQNIHLDKNQTQFREIYYWNDRQLLIGYIKYFLVQVAFGGIVQKRTVRQMLFGYDDPFVAEIKHADLMRGGDPSKDTKISLNQPNRTLQQANLYRSSMHTGKIDPYNVRQFIFKDDNQMIHYTKTSFNGYQIINQTLSPFKQWIPLKGTDGLQISPLANNSTLQYIYIDPTKRISEMEVIDEFQSYGFECRRYQLTESAIGSAEKYPENDVYWQKFTGFINASFKGAPLFISGNHFLRTDPEDQWQTRVSIYDESGLNPQKSNPYDRSELVVQRKSGALFTGTTYLQTNLYCQADLIFPAQLMLPIFTVYRSGNMSQSAAEELLGELKVGMKMPSIMLGVGITGIVIAIGTMMSCYWKEKKVKRINESLLESWERHSRSQVEEEVQHGDLRRNAEEQIGEIREASPSVKVENSDVHSDRDQEHRLNPTLLESTV